MINRGKSRDDCMTYFANHIFSEIREVIGFWHIFVRKQILIGVLGIVAMPEEKLEKVEQAQEVEFMDSALIKKI